MLCVRDQDRNLERIERKKTERILLLYIFSDIIFKIKNIAILLFLYMIYTRYT